MNNPKEIAELNAQINRLQALELAVMIAGTALSVLLFLVGSTLAKAKHVDLFFLCMVFHIINMFVANRVLTTLRKEKHRLCIQLLEEEGDDDE